MYIIQQGNILTWDGAKLEQILDQLKNQQFSGLQIF